MEFLLVFFSTLFVAVSPTTLGVILSLFLSFVEFLGLTTTTKHRSFPSTSTSTSTSTKTTLHLSIQRVSLFHGFMENLVLVRTEHITLSVSGDNTEKLAEKLSKKITITKASVRRIKISQFVGRWFKTYGKLDDGHYTSEDDNDSSKGENISTAFGIVIEGVCVEIDENLNGVSLSSSPLSLSLPLPHPHPPPTTTPTTTQADLLLKHFSSLILLGRFATLTMLDFSLSYSTSSSTSSSNSPLYKVQASFDVFDVHLRHRIAPSNEVKIGVTLIGSKVHAIGAACMDEGMGIWFGLASNSASYNDGLLLTIKIGGSAPYQMRSVDVVGSVNTLKISRAEERKQNNDSYNYNDNDPPATPPPAQPVELFLTTDLAQIRNFIYCRNQHDALSLHFKPPLPPPSKLDPNSSFTLLRSPQQFSGSVRFQAIIRADKNPPPPTPPSTYSVDYRSVVENVESFNNIDGPLIFDSSVVTILGGFNSLPQSTYTTIIKTPTSGKGVSLTYNFNDPIFTLPSLTVSLAKNLQSIDRAHPNDGTDFVLFPTHRITSTSKSITIGLEQNQAQDRNQDQQQNQQQKLELNLTPGAVRWLGRVSTMSRSPTSATKPKPKAKTKKSPSLRPTSTTIRFISSFHLHLFDPAHVHTSGELYSNFDGSSHSKTEDVRDCLHYRMILKQFTIKMSSSDSSPAAQLAGATTFAATISDGMMAVTFPNVVLPTVKLDSSTNSSSSSSSSSSRELITIKAVGTNISLTGLMPIMADTNPLTVTSQTFGIDFISSYSHSPIPISTLPPSLGDDFTCERVISSRDFQAIVHPTQVGEVTNTKHVQIRSAGGERAANTLIRLFLSKKLRVLDRP